MTIKPKGLSIADSEKTTLKTLGSLTQIRTELDIFKSHNGLRPGNLHIVMGSTGSGKSTFIRSLILDHLRNNKTKNLLLYLSEETIEDLKYELALTDHDFTQGSNLYVVSEFEEKLESEDQVLRCFVEKFKSLNIKTFIYDNITTSRFYNDLTPKEQSMFVAKLKKLTAESSVATVLVAHTNAGISDNCNRLINETDIRGSKSVSNLAQFIYILQRFQTLEQWFPTIRLCKHRGQNPEDKIYKLSFDPKARLYKHTKAISFLALKEAYGLRDRL